MEMIMNTTFCRIFQFVFNYGSKAMPWRKAIRIEGPGSIGNIPELLRKHAVKNPMLVTDNGLV
jgi:hypothetical protein